LKGKAIITSIVIKLIKYSETKEIPSQYLEYGGIQKELENNFEKPYTIKKVFEAITNIRNEKLPKVGEYGSCGSTFANPILPRGQYKALLEKYPELPCYDMPEDMVKVPAAYILEQIGWKNKRILDGKCGTWIHHPLIVTNYHDSTGNEILELIKLIQTDFKNETDLELNTEINII
jgi:UDP-N-acetylmuramate dehydrogenase